MELLERIEEQISATGLPLVGVTLAAVPCPDTPVILTLHWHGFVREKEFGGDGPAYTPVPSSTLQLNDRWRDLVAIDGAAMEAGWELGAWDVARAEHAGSRRPGTGSIPALTCLQAFGALPGSVNGGEVFLSDAPDAEDLVKFAGEHGFLMWQFRPVSGGLWAAVAGDATLTLEGRRPPPCPHRPIPPRCSGSHRTVYRFGVPSGAVGG